MHTPNMFEWSMLRQYGIYPPYVQWIMIVDASEEIASMLPHMRQHELFRSYNDAHHKVLNATAVFEFKQNLRSTHMHALASTAYFILQPIEEKPVSLTDTILKDHFAYRETHDSGLVRCIVGPPGSGKSSSTEEAGRILGVPVYTISLLATNPMEIRSIDMPDAQGELQARVASHWKDKPDYSIIVFEELDKAYIEQLHAVIDLMTSRKVGDYHLPPLHFIALANSDRFSSEAVLDRLLLTPVPNPNTNTRVKIDIIEEIVEYTGLHQHCITSPAMEDLMNTHVLPPYEMLDNIGKATSKAVKKGISQRSIISQIRGRSFRDLKIKNLVDFNNAQAEMDGDWAHYLVYNKKTAQATSHVAWDKIINQLPNDGSTDKKIEVLRINKHLCDFYSNESITDDDQGATP